MHRLSSSLLFTFLLGLLLTACTTLSPSAVHPDRTVSPAVSPNQPPTANGSTSPGPVVHMYPTATALPTIALPNPATRPATATPIAEHERTLTAWAIPLPSTIPTQTFDVRSIQKSTPEPPAQCPQIPLEQVPTLVYDRKGHISVNPTVFRDYLNQFGIQAFLLADQRTRDLDGHLDPHLILQRDLTNDGVPEIVVGCAELSVVGCKDGKYQSLLTTEMSSRNTMQIVKVLDDLNKNGVPELLVDLGEETAGTHYFALYEWGDGKFNSLFRWDDSVEEEDGIELGVMLGWVFRFQDINSDGFKDIVLYDGVLPPGLTEEVMTRPWRRKTHYFTWNGKHFALSKTIYDPPEYRFQAVVDADYAFSRKEYEHALDLYQQAIFNDKLEWWSEERKESRFYFPSWGDDSFKPTPPAPDKAEYFYLSAYARLRIMILHLIQGYESDAQVVYQTLQTKYPTGSPGSIYANMAAVFWQEYQATHNTSLACGRVRAAALEHEEEATRYLIDDYPDYGWSIANYTIGQLCPFR